MPYTYIMPVCAGCLYVCDTHHTSIYTYTHHTACNVMPVCVWHALYVTYNVMPLCV